MTMRSMAIRIVTMLVLAFYANAAFAYPSLVPADRISDLVVQEYGQATAYTVIKDSRKPNQWWYVSSGLRLSEHYEDGKLVPDYQLRWYEDATPEGEPIVNGILTFSVTMLPPGESLTQLRSQLAARRDLDKSTIELGALPLSSARAFVYDAQYNLISDEHAAPLFASQKLTFVVPLTGIDVGFAKETGVRVGILMTFEGETDALDLTFTINFKRAYEHFSSQTRARASAGFGLWSTSGELNYEAVRNEFESAGILEIMIIGEDENFDVSSMIETITDLIWKEIVTDYTPPEKVDPAAAARPGGGGVSFAGMNFGGGGGASFALKDVKDIQRDSFTYHLTTRQRVEKRTMVDAIIEINRYDSEIRERLIQPLGTVGEFAFFGLPSITDKQGINAMQVSMVIKCGDRLTGTQEASWSADQGWTQRQKPISVLSFALGEIQRDLGLSRSKFFECAEFLYSAESYSGIEVVEFEDVVPITSGRANVELRPTPSEFRRLSVNAQVYDWKQFEAGDLVYVELLVQSGEREWVRTVVPKLVGNPSQWEMPDTQHFIIPWGLGDVSVKAVFQYTDGSQREWRPSMGNPVIQGKTQQAEIILFLPMPE